MQQIEFGTDGIRGIVGKWPWYKPVIMRIGQALGEFVRSRSTGGCAVIGRDTRVSSADFLSDLCTGMMGQGIHVINLGIMTTPGVAFLAKRCPADLGVIVSASHSSLEYNGIKLVGMNGLRLQREDELEIEALINTFVDKQPKFLDTFGEQADGKHLRNVYINSHVKRCPVPSLEGLKVILDCSHGAATGVAPEIFRRLGATTMVINDTIDGNNVNYHAGSEFARAHPKELATKIQTLGADYAFAFDGDGDRLVVIDKDGRIFDGQDLLFILALYYKEMNALKHDTVVTTHIINLGLKEALQRHGVKIEYAIKGDRNLEAKMWGGDYLLGGEAGGNIIINDGFHTAADAIYTALMISGVISQNPGLTLGEMADDFIKNPQLIISFNISAKLSSDQLVEITSNIERLEQQLGEGGRVLFWESSTEPFIYRILAEGGRKTSYEDVSRIASLAKQMVKQVASEPNRPPSE